jgi:hypothetical protein
MRATSSIERLSPRERWLAAIRMQPVDRLPFWPKLDGAYAKAQDLPFRDMSLDAIHDWIGSDKHKGIACCVRELRKHTAVTMIREPTTSRTVYRTPHGERQLVCAFDAPSHSWHPMAFPIKTLEDIKHMTEVFEDVTVDIDPDELQKAKDQARAIGQDALTTDSIGESPLMYWVEMPCCGPGAPMRSSRESGMTSANCPTIGES